MEPVERPPISQASTLPSSLHPISQSQALADQEPNAASRVPNGFISDELSTPGPSTPSINGGATQGSSPAAGSGPGSAVDEPEQPAVPQPSRRKKKKPKTASLPSGLLEGPPEPLAALPASTPLPDLEDFNLRPEQTRNPPLFVAIAKVLLVYGNHWQSAMDLVDGVRHFGLHSLGGQTPRGTIQGAISTALALSAALGTFEPIQKERLNMTTYYRMDPKVLEDPTDDIMEAREAINRAAGNSSPRSTSRPSSKQTSRTSSPRAKSTNSRRKPVAKKRRTGTALNGTMGFDTSDTAAADAVTAYVSSDTLSSDGLDDDDDDDDDMDANGQSRPSIKRIRRASPRASASPLLKSKPAAKVEIPHGLKKLPKGYVYDTDLTQAAVMHLSIDPLQTGEFFKEHMKDQQAQLEMEYPDKRAEYGVELAQEPSMFAVEQQTGYAYPRLRHSGRERLPKPDCEDGYAVADLKHAGGYLGRLFCITDGHGGRACSSFVIATIPGAMQVILGKYKPSDLSLPSVQEVVKSQISEAIRLIDREYLDYKKQQYLLYRAKKISHDPGSDGTTLIVNIFIDKWVICVNVGDSRSIITSRDASGRWNTDFYSEDHTPSLERLAQTIYANGGEFVTHDDKVIKFDPTIKNDKKHRQSLKDARIRVKDGAKNLYGIPYRTRNGQAASINLGACIGDVLYKLDPVKPVLSSQPDITFIDISNIPNGYLLMASDGLWDYVQRGGKVTDQNAAVCQFVGDKVERGWNHQRIVGTLSDREGMNGLYSDSIQEYDDFTAILVTISNQHLVEKLQPKPEEEAKVDQQQDSRARDEEAGVDATQPQAALLAPIPERIAEDAASNGHLEPGGHSEPGPASMKVDGVDTAPEPMTLVQIKQSDSAMAAEQPLQPIRMQQVDDVDPAKEEDRPLREDVDMGVAADTSS